MSANTSAVVTMTAKINVSPDGIEIIFEGMDEHLSSLIQLAGTYEADTPIYRSLGSYDISVKSTKVINFVEPTSVTDPLPTP